MQGRSMNDKSIHEKHTAVQQSAKPMPMSPLAPSDLRAVSGGPGSSPTCGVPTPPPPVQP